MNLKQKLAKEDYQAVMPALEARLTALDAPLRAANLPVILIFKDWSATGKRQIIEQFIKNLSLHWFTTVDTQPPTELEQRYPYFCRHWHTIPEAGRFSIMDRSWYQGVSTRTIADKLPAHAMETQLADIRRFEKTLTDNGYLILKFFLHISKQEMKVRLETLAGNPETAFHVIKSDRKQVKHYDDYYAAFGRILAETMTTETPWTLVSGTGCRTAIVRVFRTVIGTISERLSRPTPPQTTTLPSEGIADAALCLSSINLSQTLTRKGYKKYLKAETARLAKNQDLLYTRRVPMIASFESWDATGKGGCIKHLSSPLDARGYATPPIASPTPEEKKRRFLWHFCERLPKSGHIAIFDRTWYSRILVERTEGFCNEMDWRRAYGEINVLEAYLQQGGALLVELWTHISKEGQSKRFRAREHAPEKQQRITAEDWRNRKKWPRYETAVNGMFRYASAEDAPWRVLTGNDKYFARIQVFRIVNETIEARLKERG